MANTLALGASAARLEGSSPSLPTRMAATALNHIAIIPDGNRRWAKERGLPPAAGHFEGAKNTERILRSVLDLGIPSLTIWGCSVSNLTGRSPEEVSVLMEIFESYFHKLAGSKELGDNDVRVRVLGRWREFFTPGAAAATEELTSKTESGGKRNLTFLMAYDGKDEILQAINKISAAHDTATADSLKHYLWTDGLPSVDLVIRTGGEPHWSSGFMMWDVADAQLYFTETFWPAFSPEELKRAVEAYGATERRLGK